MAWCPCTRTPRHRAQLRAFYTNWALKESFVKALGVGLGFDLRRASFSKDCGDQWALDVDGARRALWTFHVGALCGDGMHLFALARGPALDPEVHAEACVGASLSLSLSLCPAAGRATSDRFIVQSQPRTSRYDPKAIAALQEADASDCPPGDTPRFVEVHLQEVLDVLARHPKSLGGT